MLTTLSGGLSTASAVELSSNTYEILDDVGIMLAMEPGEIITFDSGFYQYSLDVLRSFVNSNLPFGSHYVVLPSFSYSGLDSSSVDSPGLVYWIFFFKDYEINSAGRFVVLDRDNGIVGYKMTFLFDVQASLAKFGSVVPIVEPVTNQLLFSPTYFLARYVEYGVFYQIPGFSGNDRVTFSPYSDLSGFVDISNRRELLPQYAAVFGLAVFLVLDILRGFWRSARGRDT